MEQNIVGILVTIIVYLGGMIAIGAVFSRKNKDVSDFYLGGRKLGPLVSAMSAEASDMSSWLLMGLPGVAFLCGAAEAGWTAIGLAAGTYLNWLFVARRLRIYSHKTNSITLPDFFADRYHDHSRVLTGVAAVIILIFFVPYTASGFSACGKLFGTLFGWDYHVAMIVAAVIIIAYTSMGGFLAASFTDLIQSIVMTTALVIIVCFGVSSAGGWDAVVDNAKSIPNYLHLTFTRGFDETTGEFVRSEYGFLPIVSTLAWGLGYFGMPHILLRFMAIENDKKVKLSRRIASIWVVIAMGVAIVIGFIGNRLTANQTIEQLHSVTYNSETKLYELTNNSETVIMKIALVLSNRGFLAAIVAGLIFAGILACTMSTSDSQLLAASSSMSENILKGVFGMKLSQRTSMIVARIVLIAIAVAGIILAWDPNSSVFRVVSFAWAGFGATFGPVMLTALFWKRSNKYGAIAGLIVGGVMIFVWKFAVRPLGGAWDIYELLPAFICALIAIVVVSLVTAPPEKEITEEFDAVSAELRS